MRHDFDFDRHPNPSPDSGSRETTADPNASEAADHEAGSSDDTYPHLPPGVPRTYREQLEEDWREYERMIAEEFEGVEDDEDGDAGWERVGGKQ